MADAIVSSVLGKLTSIIKKEVKQEVRLVVGVKKEVTKLTNNLIAIQAVLVDAEQRQVQEKTVRVWLDQLKEASYDIDDVLDEWNTAMLKLQIEGGENTIVTKKKVCFFFPSSCFCFRQVSLRRDISLKIKQINENINDIVKTKDILDFHVIKGGEIKLGERVPSTYLVDVTEICGRVRDKNALVRKLSQNRSEKGLDIVSIVGMGGIGKTTLAQFAYNDIEVVNNFNIRIWVCVSDPFDERRIAKAIIESLEGTAPNLTEFNSLLQKIHKSIIGKKFLLILDDVWTEDYHKWEPFHHCLKNGLHGSKILITTRKEIVAHMIKSTDIITIKELSEEESWLLFKRLAFFDRSLEECKKLEEIGRKIVGKCKGLPLAAKTIGSLLRFKKTIEEWQDILDSELWKLEEFEKGIFPPLLLSYNDLPSIVKQCFSYCSIFSKDYEITKDELIKLWMAQGYLGLEKDKEMEIIGQEFVYILVTRSFFQDFVKDGDENIVQFKMHDIIHDFSQYLSKNECITIEVNGVEELFANSSHDKIRHLMLKLNEGVLFPISICNIKRLHSLLINSEDPEYSLPKDVLRTLFGGLTFLRVLILHSHRTSIKEIPEALGKMIHLRYLNLSKANIEKLPKTLCKLYNLQTLDLTLCDGLKELPQGMGKLINLRHLINDETDSLSYMPVGIERLTCLRTLSKFIVSGAGDHNNKACSVDCLKDLNYLQGDLSIRGLGNVTNVSEVERTKVLKSKKDLLGLELWFDNYGEDRQGINVEAAELLLEDLQPPPNLVKLWITGYGGKTFPQNWMTSLSKLRKLYLHDCINCKLLPPLGILSSLETLRINGMKSVKRVGIELWGITSNEISSSIILFPQLKSLTFQFMDEWEEWDYGITWNKREEYVIIMPCLASLSIDHCPKLRALPERLLQKRTLKELQIYNCPILEERKKVKTGVDWTKISHISSIRIWTNPLESG